MKNIILKFLKILNILKFHYDGYVSNYYPEGNIVKLLKLEQILRKKRITYWQKIASNYPPFKGFFSKSINKEIINNKQLSTDVKNIFKTGYSIVEDVLNEKEISQLSNEIKKINLKDTSCGYHQELLSSDLLNIKLKIKYKLNRVIEHFIRSNEADVINKINFIIRIDHSINGIDKNPVTANWHVDRFIPTLNAIYFPFGSYWGEFEKDIGSPIITEQDINYYNLEKKSHYNLKKNQRDDLYVDVGRMKKKFTLPKNTMIVGTHHLQHRRSPIATPGKRVAIFLDFYELLTRKVIKNSN